MKLLYEGYRRLTLVVKSNAMRKLDRKEKIDMEFIKKTGWEARRWEKTEEEIQRGKKLWHSIDKFIKEGKAKQDAAGKTYDPSFTVVSKNKEHWGETLLNRLIRERREMPKEERLAKFRNDSVDEVDTTDLENWTFVRQTERKKTQTVEDLREPWHLEKTVMELDVEGEDDEVDEMNQYLMVRHRIDVAKMYLMKDGGYTLRKFKRIFKREMEERPEMYKIKIPEIVKQKVASMQGEDGEEIIQDSAKTASASDVDGVSEVNLLDDDEFADKSVRKGRKGRKEEQEPAAEVDFEAEKEKWREQMKKEIAEADADSEEESYNLDEEQLEALMDQAEKEIFQTEEDAIKYFEEYYKQIKAKRVKLNKYRPRIPDSRDEQDIQMLEDGFEVESL